MWCFKNGQPVETIPLLDRAFHYGDGCFTTIRVFQNKIELKARHWERLKLASQKLALTANFDFIEQSLQHLYKQNLVLNGTLKIVISRGEGDRGYSLPKHEADIYVWFYPKALDQFQPDFIKCGVLNQALGLTMPSLVGVKSLNRLEQVLLKKEADQQEWAEALVSDVQGYIVEGVSSNCFIRLNDRWITPELRYNGVHGVMRAEILARMQHHGIACEVRIIELDEVPQIQSLFFCNALHPMRVVTQIGEQTLDSQACLNLFHNLNLNQIH
ncbi:aminodeoxychorismate lyase [Acinetobacter seifertii]|uniref:aminodeoxychorismate lyase n=1 Tax=Acinetobacter seifertii TaxID=1530123 RepID=UPI000D336102|nr:aminodeoxychorismate lyase [Acinetobacter seifertii]PTV55294.1 aminodeoxychorismate lyase [Acinetobacter seifertii]